MWKDQKVKVIHEIGFGKECGVLRVIGNKDELNSFYYKMLYFVRGEQREDKQKGRACVINLYRQNLLPPVESEGSRRMLKVILGSVEL